MIDRGSRLGFGVNTALLMASPIFMAAFDTAVVFSLICVWVPGFRVQG